MLQVRDYDPLTHDCPYHTAGVSGLWGVPDEAYQEDIDSNQQVFQMGLICIVVVQ